MLQIKHLIKLTFFTIIVMGLNGSLLAQNKYQEHLKNSFVNLQSNLYRNDITAGVVIASPSVSSPNYFYHWVRDAGLTMMEMASLYDLANRGDVKKNLERQIKLWIQFEIQNQNIAIQNSTLGEPIFTVRGTIYPYPWGRPQSDGPAIRALAMMKFADSLARDKRMNEVSQLYHADMPATTPIKRDLEYVAHHWQDQGFDLWEEVKGFHFFTKMAQQAALLKGAKLAERLNDQGAADFYRATAAEIRKSILTHLNQSLGYIVPTLVQTDGWKHKVSQLDVSIILGSLYFSMDDGFLTPDDPWVVATANRLEERFINLYPINANTDLGVAIGRYPEDVYNGSGTGESNPWFLATAAYAELNCYLAGKAVDQKDVDKYILKASTYFDRIIYHAGPDGHMSEQFNRHNGYNQGAADLTWGYVSYIRAFRKCSNDGNAIFSGSAVQWSSFIF
jgi:glucoamylase